MFKNLSFNSVVAFGDSNVAGFESIDDDLVDYENWKKGIISLNDLDKRYHQHSFPNLLAQKLQIPCYNYALSGSCNQRSIRKMTEVLHLHKNSLVIFGYTNPERHEFYFPDSGKFPNRDESNYLQLGIHWEFLDTKKEPAFELNKIFVKNFIRICDNLKEKSTIVKALSSYHDCTLIDLVLYPSFEKKLNNDKYITDFSFEGYGNYFEWARKKKFKLGKLSHFKKEAHIQLADLLYAYLTEKGSCKNEF